ncbi:E3 ubiquitin-protein ligase SINA-like 7 [Panicum virgatum]|nr:E3 ubiquitin-protein ligase SINA-like 7 [Panicum virgatum]
MAEEQPKRLSQSPTGESSKKSAPNCLLSGAGVKEEPGEGEVALGGGGSRAGAAAAEQAGPAVERPRIDISIEAQLLHCAVAECNRPLKPPIFKCEAGHLLCGACRGDRGDEGLCRRCGGGAAFTHCGPELDLFVGDARVPCPFKAYGCDLSVVYHATAVHQDACAYAPCHCSVPGCPFTASPPRLRDHLAYDHAWPLDRLPGYGKPLQLRVPAAAGPHRLLVVEGDERRLFALSVRPRGAASLAVSVSCVRTAAAAGAGPRFTCMLWAQAPGALAGGKGRRLMMEADVASCAVPGGTAAEEGMALYVPPPMLRGPAMEMHLRVRIDVVDPAPTSPRSADASSRNV